MLEDPYDSGFIQLVSSINYAISFDFNQYIFTFLGNYHLSCINRHKTSSFPPLLNCITTCKNKQQLDMMQKQEKKELNLTGYTQITERFIYNRFIRLGGGSFGTVYRGYDNQARRFIAVKQIQRVNLYSLPPGQLKEIEIMRQLKHKNIMDFYGSFGDKFNPEGIFMFLELCEKGTLADLINNKITEKQTYELFSQLVDGMAYMHEKKKFHRDLKPQNLLITASSELKIADFGIAREIQEGHKTFKKCTPIYSAPEVYVQEIYENNAQVYNQKCDVFSAGYILYEMLTSEQLTKGIKTAQELKMFLIGNKNQGGFIFQHPSLTPKWIELLKNMLNFDIAKRPSFSAIKMVLNKFAPASNNLPQVRPQPQNKVKESQVLTKKVKKLVELINNRNNYLVNVLKILNKYQQERSEFIPKVYKILLLYFTLARYCYLAEDGIKQISNKQEFSLPDQNLPKLNLDDIEKMLTLDDKVNLANYLKALADRINQGKEQMKLFVSNFVITQLSEILRYPQDHIQRRLLSEFKIQGGINNFKINEFQTDSFYLSGTRKCINNLYRTAAELQVLTDPDLRIYLVCLYVANIDRYVDIQNYQTCTLPPKYQDILAMERKQLQNYISIEKNKK